MHPSPIDPLERQFNTHCKKGDLSSVQLMVDNGMMPTGYSVGLSGARYPKTKETFEWLLDHCDDVDFMYITNHPESVKMAERIWEKKGSLFNALHMAIEFFDWPLFQFARQHICLDEPHMVHMAITHFGLLKDKPEIKKGFLEAFQKTLETSADMPTEKMIQMAESVYNQELVIMMHNALEKKAKANISWWKKHNQIFIFNDYL